MTVNLDDRGPLDDEVVAIGTLQEPVRRSLYRYAAAQRRDVSRDEAAQGVGVQRALAAFHLDKLVDAGLLEATFRRLSGRTGPGAGRPAKLYHRSSSEHAVSLPPRTYDLAARLLAQAVEESGDGPARDSVTKVGRRRDLVCGMNLSLLSGVVEAMAGADLEARPDPRPGECCVTLTPRPKKG